MDKDVYGQVTEEQTKTAREHSRRLLVEEMQTEPTVRYHILSTQLA